MLGSIFGKPKTDTDAYAAEDGGDNGCAICIVGVPPISLRGAQAR
jgi:hypothetical protein